MQWGSYSEIYIIHVTDITYDITYVTHITNVKIRYTLTEITKVYFLSITLTLYRLNS